MWLTDLLPQNEKIRPTRPTSENDVGRQQSLMYVAPSDTSDTSDTKKEKNTFSGKNHHKEEGFTQVSSKNPESVRHVPLEEDTFEPTSEEIAYARSLVVNCPESGRRLHCWYCSRCGQARRCAAWRPHRPDVEFYRTSNEPASLALLETLEAEGTLQ